MQTKIDLQPKIQKTNKLINNILKTVYRAIKHIKFINMFYHHHHHHHHHHHQDSYPTIVKNDNFRTSSHCIVLRGVLESLSNTKFYHYVFERVLQH